MVITVCASWCPDYGDCGGEVGQLIKIRYSDLPAGLHVSVAAHDHSTIIYLRPGLTLAQRRAALLRARRTASMGYGPSLPAWGVTIAVVLDRIKLTSRNGAVAFWSHPLLLLPAVAVMIASAVLVMTAAVTFTIRHPQGGQVGTPFGLDQPDLGQPAPTSDQGNGSGSGYGPAGSTAPAAQHSTSPRPSGSTSPSPSPSRSPRPGPSGSPSRSPSPSPTTSPSPTPSASPTPPTPTPSGQPTGWPTPSPSPAPTPSCLYVGPLGICLHL